MTFRDLLIKAAQIIALAALIAALVWAGHTERDVEQVSREQYCADAALWAAEEARGVPLNRRNGQPDYKGIAADQCPGMRPAGQALAGNSSETLTRSTERQLAQE